MVVAEQMEKTVDQKRPQTLGGRNSKLARLS